MTDDYTQARDRMVREQLAADGIDDARVLAAMRAVPRHEFVPEGRRDRAYEPVALPIGHGQTISQPYVVALMTQLAQVGPGSRVLEVGTGSGYQTAVLAELTRQVYSIEIVAPLAAAAVATLRRLGYAHVEVREGDGYRGWPDAAPFDAILVTAAPERVPAPLLAQLAPHGRLVIPVGCTSQELQVHRRTPGGTEIDRLVRVSFVPMTGEAERPGPR